MSGIDLCCLLMLAIFLVVLYTAKRPKPEPKKKLVRDDYMDTQTGMRQISYLCDGKLHRTDGPARTRYYGKDHDIMGMKARSADYYYEGGTCFCILYKDFKSEILYADFPMDKEKIPPRPKSDALATIVGEYRRWWYVVEWTKKELEATKEKLEKSEENVASLSAQLTNKEPDPFRKGDRVKIMKVGHVGENAYLGKTGTVINQNLTGLVNIKLDEEVHGSDKTGFYAHRLKLIENTPPPASRKREVVVLGDYKIGDRVEIVSSLVSKFRGKKGEVKRISSAGDYLVIWLDEPVGQEQRVFYQPDKVKKVFKVGDRVKIIQPKDTSKGPTSAVYLGRTGTVDALLLDDMIRMRFDEKMNDSSTVDLFAIRFELIDENPRATAEDSPPPPSATEVVGGFKVGDRVRLKGGSVLGTIIDFGIRGTGYVLVEWNNDGPPTYCPAEHLMEENGYSGCPVEGGDGFKVGDRAQIKKDCPSKNAGQYGKITKMRKLHGVTQVIVELEQGLVRSTPSKDDKDDWLWVGHLVHAEKSESLDEPKGEFKVGEEVTQFHKRLNELNEKVERVQKQLKDAASGGPAPTEQMPEVDESYIGYPVLVSLDKKKWFARTLTELRKGRTHPYKTERSDNQKPDDIGKWRYAQPLYAAPEAVLKWQDEEAQKMFEQQFHELLAKAVKNNDGKVDERYIGLPIEVSMDEKKWFMRTLVECDGGYYGVRHTWSQQTEHYPHARPLGYAQPVCVVKEAEQKPEDEKLSCESERSSGCEQKTHRRGLLIHRTSGPAITITMDKGKSRTHFKPNFEWDYYEEWVLHGSRHRDDGPARVWMRDGKVVYQEYFANGGKFTPAEWENRDYAPAEPPKSESTSTTIPTNPTLPPLAIGQRLDDRCVGLYVEVRNKSKNDYWHRRKYSHTDMDGDKPRHWCTHEDQGKLYWWEEARLSAVQSPPTRCSEGRKGGGKCTHNACSEGCVPSNVQQFANSCTNGSVEFSSDCVNWHWGTLKGYTPNNPYPFQDTEDRYYAFIRSAKKKKD